MTKEHSENVVVAALAVSLALHVALMFFAKGRVMSHAAPEKYRAVKRAVMKVENRRIERDIISLSEIKDEKAERPAPESAAAELLRPSADELKNDDAFKSELLFPNVSVDAGLSPAKEEFKILPSSVERVKLAGDEPRFEFSRPDPAKTDVMFVSRAAKFAMASEKPNFSIAPARLPEMLPPSEKDGFKQEFSVAKFVPSPMVYDEVDAAVIEEEKRAVKRLLHSSRQNELSKHLDMNLKSFCDGDWTYFRLCISGRESLRTVPKDFVLLLDASGSIGSERLNSLKKSAREILRSAMNTGDRFNLVAFRDRYSYAFKSWREVNTQSLSAADRFLSTLASYGRTDVFASIESVLTLPREPKRPLIALVVTDAKANSGLRESAKIISKFSNLNEGLVSVYMYGVSNDADRQLIDILTRANRGESIVYVGSRKSGAGSAVKGLSERFRDPQLTDIGYVFSANSSVEAFPKRLKNLYAGGSVEIYGRVPRSVTRTTLFLRSLAGDKSYGGFFNLTFADDGGHYADIKKMFENEKSIYLKTIE